MHRLNNKQTCVVCAEETLYHVFKDGAYICHEDAKQLALVWVCPHCESSLALNGKPCDRCIMAELCATREFTALKPEAMLEEAYLYDELYEEGCPHCHVKGLYEDDDNLCPPCVSAGHY